MLDRRYCEVRSESLEWYLFQCLGWLGVTFQGHLCKATLSSNYTASAGATGGQWSGGMYPDSRPSQICILFHPCFFDHHLGVSKLPKGGGRGQGEDHREQPLWTAGEADLSGQQWDGSVRLRVVWKGLDWMRLVKSNQIQLCDQIYGSICGIGAYHQENVVPQIACIVKPLEASCAAWRPSVHISTRNSNSRVPQPFEVLLLLRFH